MRFMHPNFRIALSEYIKIEKITHAGPDQLFLAITQNWAVRLFVGFVMQGHKYSVTNLISIINIFYISTILKHVVTSTI